MMRKRRATAEAASGGASSVNQPQTAATPPAAAGPQTTAIDAHHQFINMPGRMPFDLQQEIPMVNSEQEIDKKLSQ